MVKHTRYVALLAAVALSACGGANVGAPIAGVPIAGASGAANSSLGARVAAPLVAAGPADRREMQASARIFIPREVKRRRGHGKHPQWVSGATNGILVVTYLSSDTHHTNPIGTLATDLSSASGNCHAVAGGRVCDVFALAKVGKNDFVFTTYNEKPVHNAFRASAKILGEAALSKQRITKSSNPAIPVYISGLIATIGSSHPYVSTSVGATQTVALSINAEDFGNQVIGGGATSPYANPMTVTLAESGGTGHASLLLDGSPSGSLATLASSADSVSIAYDGAGSAGYSMGVTVTASGVSPETLQVSPLFVTSSQYFTSPPNTLGFTAPSQTTTVHVTEANAPSGTTYSYAATPAGTCTGIATFSALSGSGAAATIPAAANSVGSGCTLTVTDSLNTSTAIAVQMTTTLGNVHVPISVTQVGTGQATYGAVLGPDGNQYYTVPGNQQIYEVSPSCGNCVFTLVNATAGTPMGITMGPDGYLWFTEQGGADEIGRVNTSGSLTEFPISAGSGATGIVEGSDGSMWFTETTRNAVGRMTASGAFTTYISDLGPAGIARGSDGRVWVAAQGSSAIDAYDTSGNLTSYSLSVAPYGIASGSDGNIWFTSQSGNVVGCMTTSGLPCTLATCPPVDDAAICSGLPAGANPAYITSGADGALWFAETGAGAGGSGMIGKITTAGVLTSYTLAPVFISASLPTTPVVAADGSIWFSSGGTNNSVGQIVP